MLFKGSELIGLELWLPLDVGNSKLALTFIGKNF